MRPIATDGWSSMVCHSQPWAVQKRLNQLLCHLARWLGWAQGTRSPCRGKFEGGRLWEFPACHRAPFPVALMSGFPHMMSTSDLTGVRWPSVLDFPGQSQFLTCPGKNHSSPGMPIFTLVSRICPDTDKLHYFTVQTLILTFFLAIFLYIIYENNRWRPGLRPIEPPYPLKQLTTFPQIPKLDPPAARECGACIHAPYDSSQIAVSKLWPP